MAEMTPDVPEVIHDGPIPGQHLTGPLVTDLGKILLNIQQLKKH